MISKQNLTDKPQENIRKSIIGQLKYWRVPRKSGILAIRGGIEEGVDDELFLHDDSYGDCVYCNFEFINSTPASLTDSMHDELLVIVAL